MVAAAYRAAWVAERGAVSHAPAPTPTAQAALVSDQIAEVNEKAEAKRAYNRERSRRIREFERADRKSQMDLFPASLVADNCGQPPNNIEQLLTTQVGPQRKVPKPLKETTSLRSVEEGGGGTRATPLVLISPEAISIADEVAVIAGLDPSDRQATPPGWCGAAARVETWLAHWPRETILAGARAGMSGKRDGPPQSPRYFEKPVARVHLQLSAPIPLIPEVSYARVREQRPATDWQSRRDNWHAARAKLAAAVASYGGG